VKTAHVVTEMLLTKVHQLTGVRYSPVGNTTVRDSCPDTPYLCQVECIRALVFCGGSILVHYGYNHLTGGRVGGDREALVVHLWVEYRCQDTDVITVLVLEWISGGVIDGAGRLCV